MTRLEELLERAAEPQPIGFDSATIGARVRKRRRVRRSVLAATCVVLVLGATTLALSRDDRQTVTYGSGDDAIELVGRWSASEASAERIEKRLDEQLERIDAEIARQEVVLDNTEDGPQEEAARQVLTHLLTQRADLQTSRDAWSGVYLDLREDGTLGGFDGCNDFSGHWTLEGDRLTVTQLKGAQNPCPPDSDTGLQVILNAGPTVGVPADASADLELRSPSGVVSFDRAAGSKALTDTELMVDLDGGDVAKVTFRTPRTVAAGSERVLARWTAVTSSEQPVSVWAAVAIEGLPEDCQLEGVARWEQLGDDIGQGVWDSYPRMDLEPGQGDVSGVARPDVPDECAGEFTLVLLMSTDFASPDAVVQERLPITIG